MLKGVAAAVISQPGDTLLSQINKGEGGSGSATSKLLRLAREAGFSGLFVGLGPRIVMTAGLVSGQCEFCLGHFQFSTGGLILEVMQSSYTNISRMPCRVLRVSKLTKARQAGSLYTGNIDLGSMV